MASDRKKRRERLSAAADRAARAELRRIARVGGYLDKLTRDQRERVLLAYSRAWERQREVESRAGCVALRRCRATGTTVGLYRTADAGFDHESDEPWATVCEDHGGIVIHRTRAVAESHLSHPDEWCPDCQDGIPPRTPTPASERRRYRS